MKRLFILLFAFSLFSTSTFAADWAAADRVVPVGKILLEKNGLPVETTFKVVDGIADNSTATTTNIINISASDLTYAGNDNEVAAVVSNEIGHIINGQTAKKKMRDFAKNAINSTFSSDNIIASAANSDFVANKVSLSDEKAADITGADLMIQAGYNPLAMVVLVTKMPGSNFEVLQGKPANSERAMSTFDYLSYNYPSKVNAGYGCQEYRNFLAYADPIVKERTANAKKLAKFNKEQQKNKATRVKNIAQYKALGTSSWDVSYELLKTFTSNSEN